MVVVEVVVEEKEEEEEEHTRKYRNDKTEEKSTSGDVRTWTQLKMPHYMENKS